MKGSIKVRINKIVALFSICALIVFPGCFGKKKDNKPKVFSFETFHKDRGLPTEKITCLAALGDKIYAGSRKGLLIYDGVNWDIRNRKNTNSLGSDEIVSLQALNKYLWIATDNGACHYNGIAFESIYTGGRARAVTGMSSNQHAVGTAFGVLVNGSNNGASIGQHEISTMLYDKGHLWIGTRNEGMFKLEGGARQYKGAAKTIMGSSLIDVPASPANCKLPGNLIKALVSYKGYIAVGTTGGLCITDFANHYDVYTAEHKEFFQRNGRIVEETVSGNSKIPGNKVFALATTDNDELLFVVTDLGLGILKDKEWLDVEKIIPGLPTMGLSSVAWNEGNLWLGTEEDGIIKVNKLSDLYADDEKK